MTSQLTVRLAMNLCFAQNLVFHVSFANWFISDVQCTVQFQLQHNFKLVSRSVVVIISAVKVIYFITSVTESWFTFMLQI